MIYRLEHLELATMGGGHLLLLLLSSLLVLPLVLSLLLFCAGQ